MPLVEDYELPKGYTEIPSSAGFWTPKKVRDSIVGRFVAMEETTIQGRKAERGVILTADGHTVSLPSHWRLNDLLRVAEQHKGPDGVEVVIVYLGERDAPKVLSGKIVEYACGYKPLG